MKEQLLFLKDLVKKTNKLNIELHTLISEFEIKSKELEELKKAKLELKELYKKKKKLKFGILISVYNLLFFALILTLILISHLIYLPFFISILITITLVIPLILSIDGMNTFNYKKIKNNIKLLEKQINEKSKVVEIKNIKQKILSLQKELELKREEINKIIEANYTLFSIFYKNNTDCILKNDIIKFQKTKCYKL